MLAKLRAKYRELIARHLIRVTGLNLLASNL